MMMIPCDKLGSFEVTIINVLHTTYTKCSGEQTERNSYNEYKYNQVSGGMRTSIRGYLLQQLNGGGGNN